MMLLRSLLDQAQAVPIAAPDGDLLDTGLASAAGVIEGVRLLQRYLTYGDPGPLEDARQVLTRAANNPASHRDLDSRWVAAPSRGPLRRLRALLGLGHSPGRHATRCRTGHDPR